MNVSQGFKSYHSEKVLNRSDIKQKNIFNDIQGHTSYYKKKIVFLMLLCIESFKK